METARKVETQSVVLPRTAIQYLKALGPGIVVAMLWLGAGDLVDSSVAGGNYGYALMWALVLSLMARFLLTEIMGKYMLGNTVGDVTVMQGYARLHRSIPLILSLGLIVLAHFYNSFFIKGAASALFYLFGQTGSVTMWAFVVVVLSFAMAWKGAYKHLEWVAWGAVASLSLAFFWALTKTGVDLAGVVKGTVLFAIPPDMGPFPAVVVLVSLIGAVSGGGGNLLYAYTLRAKGWMRPEYRKLQMVDLAIGVAAIIIIDLAVWVVGAQVVRGSGKTIKEITDLANLVVSLIGSVGGAIFWIGLFGATFDNVAGFAWGYGKLIVSGFHASYPARGEKYGWEEGNDPLYKWIGVGVIGVAPVVWSLPGMPGFVALTVFGNTLTILLFPLVALGLLLLSNRKDLHLPGWTSNWFENVLMVALTGLTLWAVWETVLRLPQMWTSLFA